LIFNFYYTTIKTKKKRPRRDPKEETPTVSPSTLFPPKKKNAPAGIRTQVTGCSRNPFLSFPFSFSCPFSFPQALSLFRERFSLLGKRKGFSASPRPIQARLRGRLARIVCDGKV